MITLDHSNPSTTSVLHEHDDVRDESNQDVRNTVTSDDENVYQEEILSTHQLEFTENGTYQGHTTPTQDTQVGAAVCFCQNGIQFLRRRHGLVLASIAPITFSIQSLFVDVLTETLDSFQVVFIHVPIFMICCFLLVLYAQVRPPRDYKHYFWLLGSGTSQSVSTCFLALALTSLSVGDAVTILYTALVQVVFFSRIILKEPMRLLDLLFAFLAFGGVVFIARPPFIFRTYDHSSVKDVTFHGIIFALAGSSAVATFAVVNRKLSTLGVNSYFCMFSNGTMVVLTSGVMTLILQRWSWPTMREWLYAMFAGVSYVCSNVTLFYALKVESATLVTVIATTEIVFVFMWQVVLLHQPPFWTSYIGTMLIVVACIGITVRTKPPPASSPSQQQPPSPPPPPSDPTKGSFPVQQPSV